MERNIQVITQVHETRDIDEVNKLLSEGWIINYMSHEPSRSRYVLIRFE